MKKVLRGIVCGLVLNVIAVINASGAQWLTTEKYGNGSDGAYAPSTSTDAPIDSECTGTSGETSLTATNTSFALGQFILIHQTYGTGAGNWELNKIANYTAGTITIAYPLTNTYAAGAQVIVVKQYSSVLINTGVTLTAKLWDYHVGGIIGWFCNGTTTITGNLIASGKGFIGGPALKDANDTPARCGGGTVSPATYNQQTANGNGGGGGRHAVENAGGSGGAGAGNAAAGTNGQAAAYAGGTQGAAVGNASLTVMTFGGGGGAGGCDGNNSPGGDGGDGGGIVFIASKAITVTGTIVNNGANGATFSNNTGGGGGAAGGDILLKGSAITLGSGLVTATAGAGGSGPGAGGDGGAGSAGRIHADYGISCDGTTIPTLDKTQNAIYIGNEFPTAFPLLTPHDQTSTNNNKPSFIWGTSTDPESQTITYTLKLSTTADFTEPVYRTVSSLTTTSYTAVTVIADGSYYWRVIASDGEMTTTSTETWQLTVDTQQPVAPTITTFYPDIATGKITKIYGTGENGTTLALYDNNNNTIPGTTTWADGDFTFTPTTPLDSGSSVYVESWDDATNTSQSRTRVVSFESSVDISRDTAVYHGTAPGTSIRMQKDTAYEFDIAVNDGVEPDPDKPVTVKAYVRYSTEYGSAGKPRITLSGLGISGTQTGENAVATGAAQDNWEELTVSGTPDAKGVVTLKVETFSTAAGAKAWVDDIAVTQ